MEVEADGRGEAATDLAIRRLVLLRARYLTLFLRPERLNIARANLRTFSIREDLKWRARSNRMKIGNGFNKGRDLASH